MVEIESSSSASMNNILPEWLESLLSEKFYNVCIIHQDSRKNEKNIFCVDCSVGICPHCLTPHASHRLLHDCEILTLPDPVFDDGLMTPDSVLEPFVSLRTSSGSSASCGAAAAGFIASTATTDIVKKKRSSKSAIRSAARLPVTSPPSEFPANRRKGVPRRSPFN